MNLSTRGLNQFVNLFVDQPRLSPRLSPGPARTREGPRSARGHTPGAFGKF